MTRYSAAHWGVYEVTPGEDDAPPRLSPFRDDPDPNPIGREATRDRHLTRGGLARIQI